MKIVTILNSTAPENGATKSWMPLLEGLNKRNVSIIAVLPDNKGVYQKLNDIGCDTIVLNYRQSTYPYARNFKEICAFIFRLLYRMTLNFFATLKLFNLLKNKNVDLIHSNVSVVSWGAKVAKKLNIPHVLHFREYFDTYYHQTQIPSNKTFFKCINSDKSYSICITKDIWRHFKLDANTNSKVIYDCVEVDTNHNDNNDIQLDFKDYFLFVGRGEKGKGLIELISAYAKCIKSVCHVCKLVVVGDMDSDIIYKAKVYEMIYKNNIQDFVIFMGVRNNVDWFMTNARAVVIPSFFEGFGRVLPEAMLCKTITIAFNSGGSKEQYDNGYNMWKQDIGLRYDNIEQLTHYLIHLSENEISMYDDMIEKAYITVKTLYGRKNNIDNVFNFFNDIINMN